MNPRVRLLAMLAAVAIVGWVAFLQFKSLYLSPRARDLARINGANATLNDYAAAREKHEQVLETIQSFVDRTLGGDFETVDHKLRSRLNRLAEQVNLQPYATGTTGSGKAKESPARSRFSGLANRELREEIDFVEHEGWITGTGTFDQALQLVRSIEAEPWLKRIDQVKFTPRDNGSRFEIAIRLTTLFLPGRAPQHELAPPKAVELERYAALAQRNPFRVPSPPPTPVAEPQSVLPDKTPAFAYDQWSLTGVASSLLGPEVWLMNLQTRESRRLGIGESLEDVVLVAANSDSAEFRIGQQRFVVAVGKRLNDRTPVAQ